MMRKILVLILGIVAIYAALFISPRGQRMVMTVVALGVGKGFPELAHVKPTEVSRDFVLVDVRDPREQAVSMIPGAITKAQFESNREKFRRSKIIFYCTVGDRASEYAQVVRRDSFVVSNLRGGIIAWAQAGLPLVKNGRLTQKIYTKNKFFSLLVSGYVPVY